MNAPLHALSVEVFTHTLGNLAVILEKAATNAAQRKFDAAVLLGARLAPDMLPLTRQIQIASDIAKNSVARLAGQDPPRFEDTETTIEQLRARLARTVDYLKSVPPSAFEGAETRHIKVTAGDRTLEFRGLDSCSAGRSRTCSFTWSPPTTSCVTTASSWANATSSTVGATGRDMTNGGSTGRLLRREREGNHGAARAALPP